jgi:hypothetical protein
MHNPYIAILLAAVAAWVFGSIWYMTLGPAWMAALGWSAEEIAARRQNQKAPIGPMALSFACEVVMAVVFSYLLAGLGVTDWYIGALTGLLVGAGFMATSTAVNNAFRGPRAMLSLIDGAHWVGVAVIQGVVLVALS